MRHIFAAIGGAMLLAGCSDGLSFDGLNPANWFDDSGSMSSTDGMTKVDNRELVPVVTNLTMDPMGDGSGVVIVATGVAAAQGYWDPVLVASNDGMPLDGFLTYEFRAAAPMDESDGEMQSADQDSRELQAAITLTSEQLEGVIGIRVNGLSGDPYEIIL